MSVQRESFPCPHMRSDWRSCPHCLQPLRPFVVTDNVTTSAEPCENAFAGCVLCADHRCADGQPSVCVNAEGGMFQVHMEID